MSYLENCSRSPAVMFSDAEYFNLSEWNACAPENLHFRSHWIVNIKVYTTSAPAVPYSCSRCQVTSVLIEQSMLVLLLSHAPAVDVSIYFANWTTAGLREQFFKLYI